jgi:hypothetical protein
MAIKLSFVSGDDIMFNFHRRIDVKHCHCCYLICRWHYRHNLGDRYCISTNSMPSSLSAYYYVLNACISIIVDCCLRPNRPDYSWNTDRLTLCNNQSINLCQISTVVVDNITIHNNIKPLLSQTSKSHGWQKSLQIMIL